MFSKRKTVLGLLAAALLFVALGFPSIASAESLSRAQVRTEFDPALDQSERVSFTEEKLDLYAAAGITGYIGTNDVFGVFVLEGPESTVNNIINGLKSDSRLLYAEVLNQIPTSSTRFAELAGHTELDARNIADAPIYGSTVKKVRVTARYASGLTESEKLNWHDTYFQYFASDGLGGLMIPGNGSDWMTIEIEGKAADVDYWVNELQNDPNLSVVDIVHAETNSQTTAAELVTHTWKDPYTNE